MALRAIGEPTRLRILMLLATGELTVKDLTYVLGQSQPRISRHLKLMHDAGLLLRFQEGSWVYLRLTDDAFRRGLLQALIDHLDADDPEFHRDRMRAQEVRAERSAKAQDFFAAHAARWDELRALHIDEAKVEESMRRMLGERPIELLVDLGTGTGRILELLADRFNRAIGIDTNQRMLGYARARLQAEHLASAQVRQGDICNLALNDGVADVVVIHQVLHYLAEPRRAIAEAARILADDGRLLIVDFLAHQLDRLRDEFAHQRLGFHRDQIGEWCKGAGLDLLTYKELPPSARQAHDGLTVSIWLAARPATAAAAAKPGNALMEHA